MRLLAKVDAVVEPHGSISLLRLFSRRAEEWVEQNVVSESWNWFGAALAVEHRYIEPIARAMQDDGLTVEVT